MSSHVLDPLTNTVESWYVASLAEPDQSRARAIVRSQLRAARLRGGLVPEPARRDGLLCGCAYSAEVAEDGACVRCSAEWEPERPTLSRGGQP